VEYLHSFAASVLFRLKNCIATEQKVHRLDVWSYVTTNNWSYTTCTVTAVWNFRSCSVHTFLEWRSLRTAPVNCYEYLP